MSQSQVYLFLYGHFDVWKWIKGQGRRYHAGINLYGKEYCYTKDGILALTHANDFKGAPLIRTFTLAMTHISEVDFINEIDNLKDGAFSTSKYNHEKNNCCDFAENLILYLLEIDHLEPELEEYLHPRNSSYYCNVM